ncbi:MAG: hydrogenase maturation nickel metallochaperone HypA [Chloroflexota bacterium]
MHELSITESIMEIVLRHAGQAGAARVTQIDLVIGDLSSIVDDSVQFYFDLISQGTLAENARLVFHRVPGQLRCWDCQATFAPDGRVYLCPECGGVRVEVVAGREFRVESIEVE